MTIMLVVGSYGGFYICKWRICLGWVALSFLGVDLEKCLENIIRREQEREREGR